MTPTVALKISLCFSHSVLYKWFWVKLCGQPELNFLAHSHTPHLLLIWYSCRSAEGLPCRPLSAVFPRHLQHVSFLCGRERKWNGKSAPPAHCGHMAREESSRSGARRPQSGIFVVDSLLASVWGALQPRLASALLFPAASRKSKNVGHKNNQKRCTFSSLIMSPFSSFPRLFILMEVDTWKGITPLQEWGGKIWPHQQSGSPLPVTHRPGWMTSIHWLPLTQTHTQWNQGKGEHADTHT